MSVRNPGTQAVFVLVRFWMPGHRDGLLRTLRRIFTHRFLVSPLVPLVRRCLQTSSFEFWWTQLMFVALLVPSLRKNPGIVSARDERSGGCQSQCAVHWPHLSEAVLLAIALHDSGFRPLFCYESTVVCVSSSNLLFVSRCDADCARQAVSASGRETDITMTYGDGMWTQFLSMKVRRRLWWVKGKLFFLSHESHDPNNL